MGDPLESSMKEKDILFLCHSYNNFQKDQIEALAPHLNKCSCLVRNNPLFSFGSRLPIPALRGYATERKIDTADVPSNVDLYNNDIYYLPTDRGYISLGERQYKKAIGLIRNKYIDFDLIHAHFLWSSGYVGLRLKERYDVPFVVTAHGYDVYALPFKSSIWRNNIKTILESADAIITVSDNNRRIIEKLGVHAHIDVMPNGFAPELFFKRSQIDCRSLLGLPQEKKVIVCVGNLVPIKGHQILIQAMVKVMSEVDALCYIVGSGQLEKDLNKEIRNLGFSDKVFLVGGRPHEEIPYWIGASDLFVLPSLMEGNPTVMFECLACGKPFIGTKVGGIPEIITSTDYGLLVEPGDVDDLHRQIMIGLFKNWDENKILEYAVQFSWPKLAERIVALYSKLLHL